MSARYVNVVGPFLLGAMLNCVGLGITLVQAGSYFSNFGKTDRTYYLVIVGFLTCVDFLHSCMTCWTVYYWCALNFANPAVLQYSPWSFTVECAITGIVASIVQFFYAYRVYKIGGHRRVIPSIIVALSAIQLGFAVGATGQIFNLHSEFAQFGTWTYGVLSWLAAASACDVLISASLVYYLNAARTLNGHTNSVLLSIMRKTVETNSLSTAAAIINAVLFAVGPGTWHVMAQLVLVKLYFNSLLVSLNSRSKIAADLAARPGNISLGELSKGTDVNDTLRRGPAIPVTVVTMTHYELDEKRIGRLGGSPSRGTADGRLSDEESDLRDVELVPVQRRAGEAAWR